MIHFNFKNLLKPFFIFLVFQSSYLAIDAQQKPNVIFILADDVGYDLLSVNGSKSFTTPNIDSMADRGINFTHCESTPLCSPSRAMLLTGKYNFRNYSNWAYLSDTVKTFGNLMQSAGYRTAFFGKLQLPFSFSTMANWGFDSYTVFSVTEDTAKDLRYKDPTLYDNLGRVPNSETKDKYCDDILTNRICNFIDSNENNPFFIYYPMSLAHAPYSPTPTDSAYTGWNPNKSDTSFFHSMIEYMDFEVGVIIKKLKTRGLDKNTILIFCGDNGTPSEIHYSVDSFTNEEGGKSSSTEVGTHVPLVAYWPGHIKPGSVNDDLIDFSDFFTTFAQAADVKDLSGYGTLDGLSFYNRLLGIEDNSKPQLFVHFNGHPGFDKFKRWVRDKTYKLYDSLNGSPLKFYNFIKDPKERESLNDASLTPEELAIKTRFKFILDSMPTWPDAPLIDNPFINNITSNSVTIGATIVNSGPEKLIDRGSTIVQTGADFATLNQGRMHDSMVALGTFSETRTGLRSQTSYDFSLYAMNADTSHSTGYALGTFYTLSRAPIRQPKLFIAKPDNCSIVLNWSNAKFPAAGATKSGYAVFYSTDSIQLVDNPNGISPSKIIKNGAVTILTDDLPNMPDTSVRISGLSKNVLYHFLLVPYTYNGITDSTYNYLTAGALTTTDSFSYSLSLNYSSKNPACFNGGSGSIKAFALNGVSPYLFDLDKRNYTSDSIFTNLKAGSYLLKVKDLNSCIDSQTVVLTNPSAIQLNVTAISATCKGDTASISASSSNGTSPYKYALNSSPYDKDSVFTNLSAGSYTLKVKDGNGCVDSESVALTSPEQLKLNLSVKDASCISGGQIVASANMGVSPYLFSFNNGQFDTTSQFKKLAKGNYTIKVEDSNKCTASAEAMVDSSMQNCFTGITISPNPTNSEFKLRVGNDQISSHIIIRVYDADGILIYSNHGTNTKAYSFGKNFMAGVYFVRVESDNNKYYFKIIKE